MEDDDIDIDSILDQLDQLDSAPPANVLELLHRVELRVKAFLFLLREQHINGEISAEEYEDTLHRGMATLRARLARAEDILDMQRETGGGE
jgi:hypothetical protein